MGIMYKVCDCEDWKRGMAQLDGFVMLGFTQGYKYTGKPFIYCPWCGKQIKNILPEEVKTDSVRKDIVYTATMKSE